MSGILKYGMPYNMRCDWTKNVNDWASKSEDSLASEASVSVTGKGKHKFFPSPVAETPAALARTRSQYGNNKATLNLN